MPKYHHKAPEIAIQPLSFQELKATHVVDQDALLAQTMRHIDATIQQIAKLFLLIRF
jgi:hypothetical protein